MYIFLTRRFLFLFIVLSCQFVFGQESYQDTIKKEEFEPITIVGDKSKSITGAGQFISSFKIEKLNQTDINNVLRTVPGVNIRDEEGFGLRPNIGLRGTPVNRSAKITIMEDGILIAPAPYADPSAYYFPTFNRMQGVEVLKGSSQIKYGPFTIGGAVNLISTDIPSQFKGFAQIGLGSFGNNLQRIWVGDSHKNFDYVFEINRIASNGFKKLDNGGNTGFNRRDIMTKIRWHTDENSKISQSLTLKFVNSNEKANESYLGLTFEDFQENPLRRYAATQEDLLDMYHNHLSLSHQILPFKGLNISSTVYHSNTFRDWSRVNSVGGRSLNQILQDPISNQNEYQIMIGKADGNIDYQSAARAYSSIGAQTNIRYLFTTSSWTHKIQLGVRYHIDQADRYATRSVYAMKDGKMVLTSAGILGNQENQIRSGSGLATYLQYDANIHRLKISPGIRFEKINLEFQNYGNADNARLGTILRSANNDLMVFLPGIGLNYKLNDYSNLFGGIHRGFSPPGMPSVTSLAVQADIETSLNYELGYRYENQSFKTQFVAFLNIYDNILGSDNVSGGGAGSGDMFNAGKANIQGIELSIEYDLMRSIDRKNNFKIPVGIAYTFTDARFLETFQNGGGDWGTGNIQSRDQIPFITPQLLSVHAGVENKNFNATLTSRFTGVTRVSPGQENIVTPSEKETYNAVNALPAFLILDFSANYYVNKTITAYTTINNLTNSKAIVANLPQGYRPNMPLSINFGLKVNF